MAIFSGVFGGSAGGVSNPLFSERNLQNLLSGIGSRGQFETMTPAMQQGLQEQRALEGQLGGMIDTMAEGPRELISQRFGTQMRNLAGGLQVRGLGGSSLAPVGQVGLEAERQREIGELESGLTGQHAAALRGIGQNVSEIFTGGAAQGAGIFSTLMSLLSQGGQAGATRGGGGEVVGGGGGDGGGGGGAQGLRPFETQTTDTSRFFEPRRTREPQTPEEAGQSQFQGPPGGINPLSGTPVSFGGGGGPAKRKVPVSSVPGARPGLYTMPSGEVVELV